jgi:hypothetical protein
VTAAPTAAPPSGEASGQTAASGPPTGRPATVEACPLCGAPLDPRQDWCLQCGAAARTRLAATPNWRAPIAAIAVAVALALGVLAAALVELAGDSGSSPPASTSTVTTAPTASVPGVATTPTTTGAVPPAGGAPTTGAATPTVTAQPESAGGIASPGSTPTVTAKSGTAPKAKSGLTPAERQKIEKFLKPGTSGR